MPKALPAQEDRSAEAARVLGIQVLAAVQILPKILSVLKTRR